MALNSFRLILILLIAAVSVLYILPVIQGVESTGTGSHFKAVLGLFSILMVAALITILVDIRTKTKKLSALSGVFMGLIAGLTVAYALGFVVDLAGLLLIGPEPVFDPPAREIRLPDDEYQKIYLNHVEAYEELVALLPPNVPKPDFEPPSRMHPFSQYDIARQKHETQTAQWRSLVGLLQGVKVLVGLITCYMGISLVMQTKDDFRFVIPYVEFAKETRGSRPTLVDTSVIIDGRILDIIQTRVFQGALVIPKFVLNELQLIADSADKLKRARGRRGLDILQKLQENRLVEVRIEEADGEGTGVDQKLITVAQEMKARVMTNDFNLNKIATLRGVDVINLNDLAKALRPVVLPGEVMPVKIIKPGENPTQGVGYLDDGTMVVVENARHLIGEELDAQVTSTLQTSAGRMIFARNPGVADTGEHPAQASGTHAAMDSQAGAEPPSPGASSISPAVTDGKPPRRGSRQSGRNPRRSH